MRSGIIARPINTAVLMAGTSIGLPQKNQKFQRNCSPDMNWLQKTGLYLPSETADPQRFRSVHGQDMPEIHDTLHESVTTWQHSEKARNLGSQVAQHNMPAQYEVF